jgi:hypothetical protein
VTFADVRTRDVHEVIFQTNSSVTWFNGDTSKAAWATTDVFGHACPLLTWGQAGRSGGIWRKPMALSYRVGLLVQDKYGVGW